jgi:hypothetical protein
VPRLKEDADGDVERYRIVARERRYAPAGRPPARLREIRSDQPMRVATMRRRITNSATIAAPISINGAGSGTWRSGSVP